MSDSPNQENILITADDIRAFDIEAVLSKESDGVPERLKKRTYFNYERKFVAEAKRAAENSDRLTEAICIFFAMVCSFDLSLDSSAPFKPKWIFNDRRGLIHTDLPPKNVELLGEIVADIKDPELKARIADVLWELDKRKYQLGQTAVDSYLESAASLEDPIQWPESATLIERALHIAAKLDKKSQRSDSKYNKVIKYIEDVLSRLNGEDPLYFSHKLMTLLNINKKGDANTYIELAEKLALRAESNQEWDVTRAYWQLQAAWHQSTQNDALADASLLKAANTYVSKANYLIKQEKPAYRLAALELGQAIEALRRISADKSYINQIHLQMLEYQKHKEDMKDISAKIDVSELVTQASEKVKGKSLNDAILTLVDIVPAPRKKILLHLAEGAEQRSAIRFYLASQYIDEQGRLIAQRSGISQDKDSREIAIQAEMYYQAGILHELLAQAFILPALNEINFEHSIHLYHLVDLVSNNPFIPPGYEEIYLRGLYYGLVGDFMVSTHLLIPQLENSIRYLLEQQGVITTGYTPIQEVYDLNRLLKNTPELSQIFSDDIIFDLRGLLVERFGSNLRNNLAHGRMPSQAFSHLRSVYSWWRVLNLCVLTKEHFASGPSEGDEENKD